MFPGVPPEVCKYPCLGMSVGRKSDEKRFFTLIFCMQKAGFGPSCELQRFLVPGYLADCLWNAAAALCPKGDPCDPGSTEKSYSDRSVVCLCQVEEDDLGEVADWLIAINSGKVVW